MAMTARATEKGRADIGGKNTSRFGTCFYVEVIMTERIHRGYVIKKATRVGRTEVVFGVNPAEVQPFVTWRTNEWGNFRDYYWGHFFKDEKKL